MKLTKRTRIHMIDIESVEQLWLGESIKAISWNLQTGFRRIKKVAVLAKDAGYLNSDKALPAKQQKSARQHVTLFKSF